MASLPARLVALVVAYASGGSCWAHEMARALEEVGYLLLDAAADAPMPASTEPYRVEPRSGGAVLRRADGCANAAALLSVGVVYAPSQPCVGSGTLERGCRRCQGRAAGRRARPQRPRLAARSGRPAGAAFAPHCPGRVRPCPSRVSARACVQVAKAGFGCEAAVVTCGSDGSVGVRLDVFAPARLWCSPGARAAAPPSQRGAWRGTPCFSQRKCPRRRTHCAAQGGRRSRGRAVEQGRGARVCAPAPLQRRGAYALRGGRRGAAAVAGRRRALQV